MPRSHELTLCDDDHEAVAFVGSTCPACEAKDEAGDEAKKELLRNVESEVGDIDDAVNEIVRNVIGVQSIDDLPHLDSTDPIIWTAEKLNLLYAQLQRIARCVTELEGLDDDN